MKFKLLTASALAALSSSAAGGDEDDVDAGPEPQTPAPDQGDETPADKPADGGGEKTTDKSTASDEVAVVAAADAQQLATDAHAKGFAEANTRMSAVFDSEEGQKNPSLAAFMLANTSASAEAIIGKLKTQPAAAGSSAGGSQAIPDTNVDLGSGTDPKALAEGKGSGGGEKDGWDEAAAKTAASYGYGSSAPVVAAQPQGNTITVPACPPTGN